MRPITVTLQAFGSYGRKVTIDFTRARNNLFLVTGDTGAGKTTIFDAIVFALYGETGSSGNKKDGVELVSQYVEVTAAKKDAEYSLRPFVELVFSEMSGGEPQIYTITRRPRFVRPARRKNAKPQQEKEIVTLTLPDGTEYPGGTDATNKKIEEITGLTKSQFMQVAMIAQGEFMELLRVPSDEKKVIFRKLFGTELFPKIVAELKARRDGQKEEMDRIRNACKTEISRVVIPEEYLRDRQDVYADENGKTAALLKEIQERVRVSDKLNVTDVEVFTSALQEFCKTLKRDLQQAEALEQQAGEERDRRRDALSRAETLLTSFSRLEGAEKTLSACRRDEPEILKAATLLEQIRAAFEIQAVFQRLADAESIAAQTEAEWKEQKEALPQLVKAFEDAAKTEAEAKRLQEEERGRFVKISDRVKKANEIFVKIAAAETDLAAKQKNRTEAELAENRAKEELARFEQQEQIWKKQAGELDGADVALEQWKLLCEKEKSLEVLWRENKEESDALAVQKTKAEEKARDYEAARRGYTEKRSECNRKNDAFLDAQAGYLAGRLHPGEPCPVCGSREHPQPCLLKEEHSGLTREIIDGLRGKVAELETECSNKAAEASTAKKIYETNVVRCSGNLIKLCRQMAESIEGIPEVLTLPEAKKQIDGWRYRLEQEGIRLKDDAGKLASLRKSVEGAEAVKQGLGQACEAALRASFHAGTLAATAEETLNGLIRQKDFSSVQEAEHILADAEAEKNGKDAAYTAAFQALDAAKKAKQKAETLIGQCKEKLPEQQKEQEARRSEYERILTDKAAILMKDAPAVPFNAPVSLFGESGQEKLPWETDTLTEQWKGIAAAHQKEEIGALQQCIEEYRAKLIAAKSAKETAEHTIGGQEKPEPEVLRALAAEAETELKTAQQKHNMLRDVYNKNTEAYDTLLPHMAERSRIMEEFIRVDGMYERLNGKQTDARMDIETFVQRYYLERILYAANRRFREMSAGQFELRMTGEEQAGQGKNHGLDLMVYSFVTGKEREVRTLSGGESFMAALSMALGMADQIQESSAVLNLDIMFIDEGFGSLDEHSRNQAVRVLKQMAGGSRLIGIISHVAELKQEIEDQLIVTKDETGSHTRWQLS